MTAPTTPVIEMVDPATLLVDHNIRTNLHLDKALIGSIKENGILVPITAVRDGENLRVRAGHRRTAAAIEAGLSVVPVVVVADDDHSDKGQATRIVGQIVENHHRAGVDDTDTVNAVAQLAAFGVSAASIARRAKLPKAAVEAAAAVAGSEAARGAMSDHADLTLEHAAWIAEFDTDPDLQARLLASLEQRPHLVEHLVQRLRDQRGERNARAVVQARFPDLPWADAPTGDDTVTGLSRLTDTPVTDWPKHSLPDAVDPDSHATGCPGHVAWLARDYQGWWVDTDHDVEAEAEAEPDPLTEDGWAFRIEFGCTQPDRHQPRDRPTADKAQAAAAAAAAGVDADEARKAERRRLIALNKAGDAAAVVRKEWLTAFSARKTAAKDASAFLLAGLAARDLPWSDLVSDGLPALRAALDLNRPRRDGQDLTDLATTGGRAAHLHLCAVLWAYEAHTRRDTWRGPQPHHRRYLAQITAWGYQPSEVEQIITGDLTEQAAYEAITTSG